MLLKCMEFVKSQKSHPFHNDDSFVTLFFLNHKNREMTMHINSLETEQIYTSIHLTILISFINVRFFLMFICKTNQWNGEIDDDQEDKDQHKAMIEHDNTKNGGEPVSLNEDQEEVKYISFSINKI